ncbi:MAG: hypothetical protein ACKOU7_07670 [Ferruginibacter sp.]
MEINKNHEFEELDGVKCGIVEKNVSPERVAFLKKLLEFNKFTVVVVPSPPPKVAAAPVAKVAEARPDDPVGRGEEAPPPPPPPAAPETFTVGVTDYTYNTINAIYGRLLKTPDGHIVTMAYWNQKEAVSHDEIPYYEDVN